MCGKLTRQSILELRSPSIRCEDVAKYLASLPECPIFDLTVTSPPYDIGKPYERRVPLDEYTSWQKSIISEVCKRTKPTGSVCWQVGNWVDKGEIWPLDILLAPVFRECGMKLRNRIIWHFGHGTHAKTRFSGRYETVLWFTKTDNYTFNLDAVRIPAKYPGKRHFKGEIPGWADGQGFCNNDLNGVLHNYVARSALSLLTAENLALGSLHNNA